MPTPIHPRKVFPATRDRGDGDLDRKHRRDRACAIKQERIVHRDVLVSDQLDDLLAHHAADKRCNIMDRPVSVTAAVRTEEKGK